MLKTVFYVTENPEISPSPVYSKILTMPSPSRCFLNEPPCVTACHVDKYAPPPTFTERGIII